MKKRIISLLLVFLMCVAILPVFAKAENNGVTTFTVVGGTAFGGDTVSVKVNLSELTEGLVVTQFNLVFDSTRLEYVEGSFAKGAVTKLDDVKPVVVSSFPSKEGYSQIYVDALSYDSALAIKENGDIYTFEFKIKKDAIGTAEVFIDKNTAVFFTTSLQQLLNYSLESGAININVKAESITLTPAELNVTLGQQSSLKCEVLPDTSTEKVTWVSSNPEIVEVADGVLTGKALGSATITATTDSGLSASSAVTVVPTVTSMLKEPSVKLITDGPTVSKKVELVIPGPYPNKWTAYSNDHFIYVTEGRKYEVAQNADSATEVQELTIMCDPNQLQGGTYTGTVTIVCGDVTERLLVYFELTQDVNYEKYWIDIFPENPYRVNLAVDGEASASSYLASDNGNYEGEGNTKANAANDGDTNYWPRWFSEIGVWGDPERGIETTTHWWMLDFKSPKTFDKIITYGSDMEWCCPKEFKIVASNNKDLPDDQWYEIKYVKNTSQRYNTIDFDPVTFRYVKFIILQGMQDRMYKNAAVISEIKILSRTDYPEVDVAEGPETLTMKVDAPTGVDVLASTPTDAFSSIDTKLVIKAYDMFSDEYMEASEKLEKILGYSPIFTMNDIYAFDTTKQTKVPILNGRKVSLKISVPGGFDYEKTRILRVMQDGSFENVQITLETIAQDEYNEITYMTFDTDEFGQYIFIEDKYDAFGKDNPSTSDVDMTPIASLLIIAGIFFSTSITKRLKYLYK